MWSGTEDATPTPCPAGGIEGDELPIIAAARELHEETGLEATSIKYLFTHEGKYNDHHLYEVEAEGEVVVQGEVDGFTWWGHQGRYACISARQRIVARLSSIAEGTR